MDNSINIMNNVKLFSLIAMAMGTFLCNACESTESMAIIVVEPVVQPVEDEPRISLEDLFEDCFVRDNPTACQQLLALAAQKAIIERAELHAVIVLQQAIIDGHEELLQLLMDEEVKRAEQKRAKKEKHNKE